MEVYRPTRTRTSFRVSFPIGGCPLAITPELPLAFLTLIQHGPDRAVQVLMASADEPPIGYLFGLQDLKIRIQNLKKLKINVTEEEQALELLTNHLKREKEKAS